MNPYDKNALFYTSDILCRIQAVTSYVEFKQEEIMYKVEQIDIFDNNVEKTLILFESEDLQKVMQYWSSYASGVNDVDPVYPEHGIDECASQNFTTKHYYRIVNES